MNDVETEIEPPPPIEDGDEGSISGRLAVHWIAPDDASYDAAVQLFGDAANDPRLFADAVLRSALALASLVGPEHSWAVMERLAAYDGMQW
jgi:hypothetical protein